MAGICTSVDYAIELLKGLRLPMGNDYDTLLYWKDKIQLQLKFLRTFLRYIAKWSDDDKAKYLGSLPMNIEAALKVAEQGLEAACAEANDNLMPGRWTLLSAFFDIDGSISPFEGQVAESYNYLSTVSHPHVSDHLVFHEFVDSVQENLEDLAFKLQKNYIKEGQTPPSGALDLCLAVKQKLEGLRCFFRDLAKRCIDKEKMQGPLADLAAVVFGIAQLSYRCLPHTRLNVHFIPRELFLTLTDLSRKVTPHTPKFVEVYRGILDVYVGILKASKPSGSLSSMTVEDAASSLLSFLCSIENQVDILCEGLAFPSMALVDTPEDYSEETELILQRGISDVAREAGSLDYSFGANELQDKVSEANYMFSKLLQQIKLIKAEIFLLELQNHRKNLMNPPKDRFEALREMLRFLSSFFRASYEDTKDSGKLILTHIVAVVREAVSFHNSFHAIKITEDVILRSSLEIFKLCKAEAMLMMLINNTASLTFLVKYRIQTLHKGLRFLRELLTVRPKNKEEDGEFSSTLIETVAAEATIFVCSFGDSKIKDDHSMEMKVWLSHFAGIINPIKAEIKAIYLQESLLSIFPKTDGFGFIEFILQKLKELLTYKPDSVELIKDQVEGFLRELEFLGPFLRDVTKLLIVHQELKDIGTQIIGLIYEAEYVVDLFVARDDPVWYHRLLLFDVIEEIKLIKSQVEFYYNKRDDHQFISPAFTSRYLTSDASTSEASILRHSISEASNPRIDEAIVGFDDQADILINQLTRGSMHLDIVSIVGMPGLGKTALAKKILIDPSIKYHFIVRAWCCISQVYKKGEVLLDLLGHVIDINDENDDKNDYEIRNKSEEKLAKIKNQSEEDLAQTLYQELKGKRYLIVMDDMWTIGPWNDLKCLFPDDENGSRVLFTSRIREVALQGNPNKEPHSLRSLSDEESWELLQNRLFHGGSCPEELLEVGGQIAKNCKGLPLAVVVIAGLLKRTDKNKNWWKKVAENLRSHILDDPQKHFMEILALSYNHLPDYLKPCFLYFASFLEDQHIPVWKLKCLWISEGFITQNCEKSLEETAEEYLMELIGRSLVMEATKRSKGGTKACHVHDMLRDLCLEKAREENFLRLISRHDRGDPQYYFPSNIITCEQYRLCIHSEKESFVGVKSFGPCIHSLLYYATNYMEPSFSYDIQFIFHQFKLLRVLDLECIDIGRFFPSGIELLVQLRYLALRGGMNSIPSSIADLWRLENFIVKGTRGEVVLPNTIWGMARLRHVQVNNRAAFSLPGYEHESSILLLHNLTTLSSPTFSYGKETEKVLKRLVGLRKLRCIFLECLDSSRNCNMFPQLDFLTQLESLKIFYYGRILFPCEFSFPLNLKKLTLSKFRLPWEYISAFTRLPNLEVLKLLSKAFEGQTWNMAEGEFPSLKFLKLEHLNIANWNASYDNFPKLQRLVLQSCKELEEVPSCFGEISTLQMIEVHWCSPSVANSVGMIEEQQIDMGNEEFKFLIHPPAWDLRRTS